MSSEARRLEVLAEFAVLDTPAERVFDDLARAAAQAAGMPIASITLVAKGDVWIKAAFGLASTVVGPRPRQESLCGVVFDRTERSVSYADVRQIPELANHPSVVNAPGVRAFCGVVLSAREGERLGMLCVVDVVPRIVTPEQLAEVERVAETIMLHLELRRTERILQIERERLESSQRLARCCSFEIDVRTGRTWVSDEQFRMLGVAPRPFASAEDYRALIHPDDFDGIQDVLTRCIETGELLEFSYRMIRHNGQELMANTIVEPVRDSTGEIIALRGSMRDVTALRLQERELRDSEQRYHFIFSSSVHPMWVYNPDTLQFLDVNEAAIRRYGYSREEFLSMTLLDIRPDEEHDRLVQMVRQPISRFSRTAVWRHRWKNGELREVQLTVHQIDWHGTPARLALPIDVTEQRRADRELRSQAMLLQKARDAIVLRDAEGVVRQWNGGAERLFGISGEEAIGRPEASLLRFTDALRLTSAIESTEARGGWDGELRVRTRDDRELVMDASWTRMEDGTNGGAGILAIYTDVTERRRIEGQFLRAQRLESIGTLAGGIAHDLNNMLAPIVMSIELMRDGLPADQLQHTLDTIELSARRGSDLVRQVLSFARGVDGVFAPLSTAALLDDIVRLAQDTFPRSIFVRSSLRGTVPAVVGDATQLHQVLLNLCVNARDAMPNGGELTLVADRADIDDSYASLIPHGRPGHFVRISVSDTGEGIASDVRERMFEPFFSTKGPHAGTGLGLSTALGIVRSHGGFINVYSEPGRGSTFNVYLPAHVEEVSSATPDVPAALPRGRGELILVVDDEAAVRTITGQTLETFGYRTLTAGNGAAALQLFEQYRSQIELILTDVMMPIMDGPSLARAVLAIEPTMPIISASGLDTNGGDARAASMGVRHFLPKPYTARTLLEAIRDVLASTVVQEI